jgi:signal transduction histidine kinase
MDSDLGAITVNNQHETAPTTANVVGGLLDAFDESLILGERGGRFLFANRRAQQVLRAMGFEPRAHWNLFTDLFKVDPEMIFHQIASGEREVSLQVDGHSGKAHARVQWITESDWLIVKIEEPVDPLKQASDSEIQPTVQELLQEREITYRNLLAAYLRLQEVNRQKTVFLASAAHELKTPLAVIKGYYDLLLTGSLGKLTDTQSDILQESKESCVRLVRLVSMFLNYSALESGKLVLHLRENDLLECLGELAQGWQKAFQRKQVRLEAQFEKGLPVFKFDYQKVQQAVANLLDNALKHTPAGGSVTLRVRPHFWERRVTGSAPRSERRRSQAAKHNSVEVAVSDTGPGIAAEHHQEIFEDFVRVDSNTSGMGLGLAIAKRLVQAHRGKIWVDSEPRRGCTFTFLLPTDDC